HWAVGKYIIFKVAVVARIGIDDASNGPVLRSDFGLDTAPGIAIARNHDGSLHRDAKAVEFFVVFGNSVVHIDERRGDIAVNGIGVVSGQLLALLVGDWVLGNRRC